MYKANPNRRRSVNPLETIYRPGWLESQASKYHVPPVEMEDIRQAAATKFWRASAGRIIQSGNAYLHKVVGRCVVDHIRSRKRQPPTCEISDRDIPVSMATSCCARDTAQGDIVDLKSELSCLSIQQQQDISRLLIGDSYQEIAEHDRRSVDAVRHSVFRATLSLRQRMI
jgi:DNA-directed RNA polymerase specialized sigma24 family protein